jgi:hypothetical protein
MKRVSGLLIVAFSLGAVACGNNDCEDAADKLVDECGLPDVGDDDEAAECNEDAECLAQCINDASCSEIKAVSEDITTENSYSACLGDCLD